MYDLHNRRDFLKTSVLAVLGSATVLKSGENQLLATPPRASAITMPQTFHQGRSYYAIRLAQLKENLKQVVDNEPNALYIQGRVTDFFVHRGLLDELGEALELMKESGLPSGLGAHMPSGAAPTSSAPACLISKLPRMWGLPRRSWLKPWTEHAPGWPSLSQSTFRMGVSFA
jgi:hypothetical protein